MKWYNNNRTKMVDLDSVQGYVFVPSKEYIEQNPSSDDVNDFKTNGDRLELIIGGTPYVFRGETAREIYNLLEQHSEKQLLED